MRRYFKRSLKMMMREFLLETGQKEFPHSLLMNKKEQFSENIPSLKKPGNSKEAYYGLMCAVRDVLRDEDKKILINKRGWGYKFANDPEKEIESYIQIERAFTNIATGHKIINTVKLTNLDNSLSELHNTQKTILNVFLGVNRQFIKELSQRTKFLPKRIKESLKKEAEIYD